MVLWLNYFEDTLAVDLDYYHIDILIKKLEEDYKPISGYEDRYIIFKDGSIYSNIYGSFIKPFIQNGSLYVRVSENYKRKEFKLDILLAKVFIPNPNNYKDITHIDGNKLNNDLANLQWISKDESDKLKGKVKLNSKLQINNKSGYKNVQWCKTKKCWRVSFSINNKNKHFGYFISKNDAIQKAEEVRNKLNFNLKLNLI